MRCDDIHEYLVELLYDEGGTTPATAEIQDHLRTCPDCSRELAELRQTRKYLHAWKDEQPLRRASIPGQEFLLKRKSSWRYLRYAAVAAMACICILAAANSKLSVNKDGFSFSTHIFPQKSQERDYYTKSEVRSIIDDSESRMNETNNVMAQKVLETIEQERWMDLRYVRSRSAQNQNRN